MKGQIGKKDMSTIRDEVQLALFRVGTGEFAVDIMRIMEIIRPQKVTGVPKAPQFMLGIINLRGKVVPVFDMRGRFGASSEPSDARKNRIIIVSVGGRVIGIEVDEVLEVIYLQRDHVEETPDSVKGPEAEFLEGVGKVGDRLILILDLERLLTGDEIHRLGEMDENAD